MSRARVTIAAAVLILLAFGGMPPAAASGQKALLVGVGSYPHLPADRQLLGPPHDARAMRAFLVDSWGFDPSDIRVLIDEQATKRNILEALENWLPASTVPGDRVVIYYSGHGSRVPDDDGDEEDGRDETFVPFDYGPSGERAENMLRDDEVGAALTRLDGRRVLLIADSCYSGTVSRSLKDGEPSRLGNARPRYLPHAGGSRGIGAVRDKEPLADDLGGLLTLSAALPHQLAWEEDGAGLFTRYLIEGLTDLRADLNGNGRLTSAELITFIKPRTENWCRELPQCERYRFTPNQDPKHETFVLQPATFATESPTTVDAAAVSDILPELEGDSIAIAVRPGQRLRVGDVVTFRVTSAMAGHLTLLDLNAAGELALLFPTADDLRRSKVGRIRAGRSLTVPDPSYGFTWRAQPPTGNGTLIAIVTRDRIDLSNLLDGYRNFEPVADRLAFMQTLAARLYAVWTGDEERNRAAEWAVGYSDYWIGD